MPYCLAVLRSAARGNARRRPIDTTAETEIAGYCTLFQPVALAEQRNALRAPGVVSLLSLDYVCLSESARMRRRSLPDIPRT